MIRPLYFLICDESGAKGYSDKTEPGIESLGLAVGVVIDEHKKNSLDSVYTRY